MNYKEVLENQIKQLVEVQEGLVKNSQGNECNIVSISQEIRHLVEIVRNF